MCGCGKINGSIKGMPKSDGVDIMAMVGQIGAGAAGFKVAQAATTHIEFLKSNPLYSGGAKIAAAIGVAFLMPDIAQNEYGAAALVGMGINGAQDLLSYAGINGIGSISYNNRMRPQIAGGGYTPDNALPSGHAMEYLQPQTQEQAKVMVNVR